MKSHENFEYEDDDYKKEEENNIIKNSSDLFLSYLQNNPEIFDVTEPHKFSRAFERAFFYTLDKMTKLYQGEIEELPFTKDPEEIEELFVSFMRIQRHANN